VAARSDPGGAVGPAAPSSAVIAIQGPGPSRPLSPIAEQSRDGSSATLVQALSPEAVFQALASSRRGLSDAEAARRLGTAGANVLPPANRRSVVAELAAQFANLFVVVLVVASVVTFLAYLLQTPRQAANLELAVGILGVVVLNAGIGFVQEHSAERTAAALEAMMPARARVLRGGELAEIPAAHLVPGDLVVLEAGDAVSADCRVIEAHSLSVEMAALTGESQPAARTDEPVAASSVLEARNCVLMGATVVSGTARAVVFATGLATEFGRIYRLTAAMPQAPSPLQRQVSDMARRVAAVAIGAGAALFALRVLTGNPLVECFIFALGVMVALVPEGLPATLSVSLAIGVRRMAARQALIKRLAAVEALGSTTVICTDKTGTLTEAEMTLEEIWAAGQVHLVTGAGYGPEGSVADVAGVRDLLRVAALCSDARLLPPLPSEQRGWRVLGDTTEGALLVAAAKAGVVLEQEAATTPRVAVFPFDAERKLMTTVHQVGSGFEAYVKGSPQAVLDRCTQILWADQLRALDPELRTTVTAANDRMAAAALRVLAVARHPVASEHPSQEEAESGLTLLGLVGMSDPPRPEVVGAVAACHRAGIRVLMVTGDYGLTAEAIARRVGVVGGGPARVVSGDQLDQMTDPDLAQLLQGGAQPIFARVRPEHKMRVVAVLQRQGEVVAVTGDGVNDAPALKQADIGVAMGRGGTDVARAAAVMVLRDDSFASIAAAVELGRSVYQNIRRFLVYLFSHNLAELAPILVAALVGFPLVPLSALQVLSIDLGSDIMPALALGAERPEPGTMDRPPRAASEHLFSLAVVRRFLFLGTNQSAGVVFAFFWVIHSAHLPFAAFTARNPTYREAVTMVQVGIIVSQFFNSFAVRSDRESIWRIGLLSNLPLVGAGCVALAFAAAVSYLPPLQGVFNTGPLSLGDWAMLTGFGAFLLLADEARKAWHRGSERRRKRPAAVLNQEGLR